MAATIRAATIRTGIALASVAVWAMTGAITAAQAQETDNRVAVETAWSVFVDGSPQECWAVSRPAETVNTRDGQPVTVRRGDILLFATYRDGGGETAEISFTGGYPFRDGSTVGVQIGDTEFQLFTDGNWAWAGSPEDDARLLQAMRRGREAVVTGVSGRGTTTRDTFNLFGFTAATEEAQRRCN